LEDLQGGKDFNLNAEDHPEFARDDKSDQMQAEEEEPEDGSMEEEKELDLKQEEEKQGEEKKDAKIINIKASKKREHEKLDQPLDRETSKNEAPATTLFIKSVPPTIGKTDLIALFGAIEGFQVLSLSEPMKFKNFHRLGWVIYDTPEHCAKAVGELNGRRLKEFDLMLAINKPQSAEKRAKITPPVASEEARIAIDVETTMKLCEQLDKEKSITSNPLLSESGIEGLSPVELLDKRIAYLRRVHFYCYYCGEEYEDEQDLKRKCGQKHLRGRRKESDAQIDVATDTWASSLDQKNEFRLKNPDAPDIYTATLALEKIESDFITAQTAKIAEDKFRCMICSKLFAADHFVKKHLTLKHEDKFSEVKKLAFDNQYFENYLNDPKKIQPPQTSSTNQPDRRNDRRNDRQGRNQWANRDERFPSRDFNTPKGRAQRGGRAPFRGAGRDLSTGRAFDRPVHSLEPPPGVSADPRALREYVDLDAPPEEEIVHIDYRSSLPPITQEKDD